MRLTVKPWTAALLATLAFGATSAVGTENANAACGEVAISKGDVKIENVKTKASTNAVKGTKVCQGDAIVAGPQSRAKIVMEDGNELNISPESRIVLEQYEYKPADNKKKVMLNVLYGKVRAATKEENMYGDKAADGQANAFQVKTKSAVAGVRGTDFLTSFNRNTNRAEIVTFKGRVDVGTLGANGVILNPVSVGPNQKTEALPGSPPAPPKPVPARDMEKMNADTKADIATGPKDNGSNQPNQNQDGGSGDKKDDKKDVAKDGPKDGPKDGAKDGPKDSAKDGPKDGGKENKDGKSNAGRNGNGGGGPGGVAGGTGGANGSGSGSGDDKKGPVAGQPTNQPNGTAPPPPRAPSSLPPGGSMIDAGDLGKAPGQSPALPSMPVVPIYAPPVIGTIPTVAPVCDLCNRAIESGPGQVKITITIPN
jgi:hypothetical protein